MTFSVRDIAQRYAVSEHTVGTWIRLGDLPAVDVSRTPGARPRWRISESAIEAFELRRAAQPVVAPKRRRKSKDAGVVEFY